MAKCWNIGIPYRRAYALSSYALTCALQQYYNNNHNNNNNNNNNNNINNSNINNPYTNTNVNPNDTNTTNSLLLLFALHPPAA